MPFASMIGRCTRVDQNGNQCTFSNNDISQFNNHDKWHDSTYACPEPRCHLSFNAFEYANPKTAFRNHQESHQSSSNSMIRGSSKIAKRFQCIKKNPTNGKLCGYSFDERGNLTFHQRQHIKVWTCGERKKNGEVCGKTFSAFTSIWPQNHLINHQARNHNIQAEVCPDCGTWFRDLVHKGIMFSCKDRRELHRIDGKCFNYAAPINYLWLDLPAHEHPVNGLDDQLIAYSGRSFDGWGRPFDQIVYLDTNYCKPLGDPTRNNRDGELYEQTVVRGNGLYLMGLSHQAILDRQSFDAACALVTSFESASRCTFFELSFSCYSICCSIVTCL